MEHKIFQDHLSALNKERLDICVKIEQLKNDYITELPIKIGDKVNIKYVGICWIGNITISDYGTLTIKYFPPKKNGEKSNRLHSAWNAKLEDIEVLQHG